MPITPIQQLLQTSISVSGYSGFSGISSLPNVINATSDTSSSALYPVMVGTVGTDTLAKASSANLSFNASTGTLTTTILNTGPITNKTQYNNLTLLTGATGVVTHDFSASSIFNHSSISGNFTVNVTNLNLSNGYATNMTLILNQGATPYVPTALQVGGSAQTINWLNGVQPAGTATKKDIVSFSIANVSSSYVVLGQLATYG